MASLVLFLASVFAFLLVPVGGFLLRERLGRSYEECFRRAALGGLGMLGMAALPLAPEPVRYYLFLFLLLICAAIALPKDRELPRRLGITAYLLFLAVIPLKSGIGGLMVGRGYDDFGNVFSSLGFLASGLKQGEFPLWNPVNMLGQPFGADPMWGAWYPLNFLFSVFVALLSPFFPGQSAPEIWHAVFNYYRTFIQVIEVTGMYFLLRQFRLSSIAALFGCLLYPLHVGVQLQFMWIFALLPWVLFALRKACDSDRPEWAVVSGVLVGSSMLGGLIQGVVYMLYSFMPIVALSLWDRSRRASYSWRIALRQAAICAVVALTFGLILWKPALDYVALCYRWIARGPITGNEKLTYQDTLVGSSHILDFLRFAVLSGAAALFFFVAAAFARPNRYVIAFGAVGVVFLLCSFGDAYPLHPLFFKFLPLWNSFRELERCLFIFLFCLSFLAAYGVDALLAQAAKGSGVVLAALAAAAALTAIYFRFNGRPPYFDLWTYGVLIGELLLLFAATAMPKRSRARAIGALMALLILANIGRLIQSPSNHFDGYATLGTTEELALGKDLNAFFTAEKAKRPGPFRIRFETKELHLYSGFYYGWETASAYGGLALRAAMDHLWNAPPADKNIAYAVFEKGYAKGPPPGPLVHENAKFWVYEIQPVPFERYQLAEKGAVLPSDRAAPLISLGPQLRNSFELAVAPSGADSLQVSVPYFKNWKASINGEDVEIQDGAPFMRVSLKPGAVNRVRFVYRDGFQRLCIALALLTYLGLLAWVVRGQFSRGRSRTAT